MAKVTRKIKNVVKQYTFAEIKIREATSNDPGGPTPKQLDEIAELSYHAVAVVEILGIIWKRLSDGDKYWRHLYKSLIVLEHLIKCGSEKVTVYSKEKINLIKQLTNLELMFEGHDVGAQISLKAKQLVSLLNDNERLHNERTKMFAAKRNYAKNTGVKSPILNKVEKGDTNHQTYVTRPHSTTPTRQIKSSYKTSDYKTDNDDDDDDENEDDIQLKLALAMSKEEHEIEKRLRQSEDLKLQQALKESVLLNDSDMRFWELESEARFDKNDNIFESFRSNNEIDSKNNGCITESSSSKIIDKTNSSLKLKSKNDSKSEPKPKATLLSIALSSMSTPPISPPTDRTNNKNNDDFNLLWDDNAFDTTNSFIPNMSNDNVADPWSTFASKTSNDTNNQTIIDDPWKEFDSLNIFNQQPSTTSQTMYTAPSNNNNFSFAMCPTTTTTDSFNFNLVDSFDSSKFTTFFTSTATSTTTTLLTTANNALYLSPSNPFFNSNATTNNFHQMPSTFSTLITTNHYKIPSDFQENNNIPQINAATTATVARDLHEPKNTLFQQSNFDFYHKTNFSSTNPFL